MSTALTVKQKKFTEVFLRTGNRSQAARAAGFAANRARQTAYDLLVDKPLVRDHVNKRRAVLMDRWEMRTEEVVGALAEIATSSIGDVLEENGSFDIEKCRDRCTDHLIKKIKVTRRVDRLGEETITTELEMYSRLEALAQLVGIFGLKQSDKSNDHDKLTEEQLKAKVVVLLQEWVNERCWPGKNPDDEEEKKTASALALKFLSGDGDVIETTAEDVTTK